MFAEPSIGIDAQGLATIETEQRVLVTAEPSVSSVPAVSAAERTSAPAGASAAIADTSQYTPNTVLRAQPAPEARNQRQSQAGGLRSQQIRFQHRYLFFSYILLPALYVDLLIIY